MSIASEAAVTALMGHMHEVETRRRLVMIRLKDSEARAAHCAAELAVEKKNLEQLGHREASLTHQLRMLSEEHELAALRHAAASSTLKHVQQEEPLLVAHAAQQRTQAGALAAAWEGHLAELQGVFQAWSADSLIAPLRQQLEAQRLVMEQLVQEEQQLLQEAALLNAAAFHPSAAALPSAALPGAEGAHPPVPAAMLPTDPADLERELHEAAAALAELTAANGKQQQSWDREAANLRTRIAELQQWVTGTEAQSATIRGDMAMLQQMLATGVCRSCS